MPHLVVSPAGLPHAQSLGLGELPLEAEQDPAVAEEHLQPVLSQGTQVLVEAGVHQPQQLTQVQLQNNSWLQLPSALRGARAAELQSSSLSAAMSQEGWVEVPLSASVIQDQFYPPAIPIEP